MKEISVILKNNVLITLEEIKALNRYSCHGRMWTLIQKPHTGGPYTITQRTVEYIFEDDALTMFGIISTNILVYWETDITKNLRIGQEYQLKDTLFIRPYYRP